MPCDVKAGHRLPWHRASVTAFLSVFAQRHKDDLCVPVSSEKLLAFEKNASCPESRMFYSCVQSPVTVEVNTLASKCAELIGNAAGCLKAQRTPQKGDLCVLASSSCSEAQECNGDLWPA